MSSEKYTRNSILKRTNELEDEFNRVQERLFQLQQWATRIEMRLQVVMDLLHTYNIILSILAFFLFLGFINTFGTTIYVQLPEEFFNLLDWFKLQGLTMLYNLDSFLRRKLQIWLE